MKSIRILSIYLISLLLITFTITQDQPVQQLPDHNNIQLNKPYPQQLKKENNFAAKYRINIPQAAVTQLKQSKWFLFVEVQTTEQFAWQKTKIELFTINQNDIQKPIKQCDTTNGLDTCFLTNANFDYKKQKIQARITCQEFCKFTLSAQISTKYKLTPDSPIQLNFQNTAYSKLFQLDTNKFQNFKRLQIILKPTAFLSYNVPIRIYVNKGDTVPTKQKHHYAGMHLWDDGMGVFINYPDAANLFTILVQGPEKNILTLKANIIYQDKPVKTQSYDPYFAFVEAQQKRLFEININKAKKTVLRLTTLTGSIQLSGIKDQSFKDIEMQFTPLSRSYGELEYKFQPQFFEKNKDFNITDKIIVQIKGSKDSTFVFQSYVTDDLMNLLTPEVNRYADLPQKSTDIYYFSLFQVKQNINQKKKQARIEIMTTTFQGIDLGTKVLLCKAETIKQCQPTKEQIQKLNHNDSIDNDKRKQLRGIPLDNSIPGVVYLDTLIPYTEYSKKEGVYHIYVIVVINNPKDEEILYTVQYIDLGTTYFLKQKQLRRDRLSIDQIKYYTFVNNDKDVKAIKIHSTQISGEMLMVGYKEDPRYNILDGKQIYQYHGTVAFLDVQPGQQVYLMVQGIQNSYYSLYLQLIRQSENSTDQKGSPGYNQIIVEQNVKYDFYIKPNEKIIVQMHVKNPEFQLYIGSLLPLDLCLTQVIDSPPFKPNCEVMQTLTKNQRIGLKMDKGLIGNMGITNNNNKSVQLKLQIIPKTEDLSKCMNATLGVMNVWSLNASDPKNTTKKNVYCYKFQLNRRQSAEIIVQFNNMEYDNQTVSWQLNDKQKELLLSQRHVIMKKEIQRVCGSNDLQKCQLTIIMETNYSTDVEVIVQYLDKDVLLVDGMAQPSWSKEKNQPKHFRYQMLNMAPTTIILENRAGIYHFYGKIISRKDFYAAIPRQQVFPTAKDHLFVSQNPFYFLYQIYQLKQQTLKKSGCKNECVLLITVATVNDQSQQDPGRFIIQVSQEDRFLKQNQPSVGYLQRKSIAFYQYYNPSNGTIYVQLSNQNSNCAKIYIKKGGNSTKATPSAFDKMAENQNYLMYQNAQVGTYSIAVQAKGRMGGQGCSYTIQALSSQFKVARIKRGTFNDRILQANQTSHFLYEHNSDQSFKILSLTKIGQIMIKVKVLKQGQLNTILSTKAQKLQKYIKQNLVYQDSNIDFLKVHHKKSAYFCSKCTYLISIQATKYSQTSIVIPSADVQIPIVQDATIKDEVKEGEVVKYRVFTSNVAQYKLYVQYGTINVTITQSIQNKTILSKVYAQTKEPIYQKFNSTTTKTDDKGFGYQFLHYDIFTIVGVANSSFYSFELLTTQSEQKGGGNVKYGIPEYFFLQAKQTKCFKGMIDDDSQQFVLSFDESNRQQIKNLSITAKVNDNKRQFKTEYGVNQMTLELSDLKLTQPSPYQICLYSLQLLSLTFIQSAHIMIVPPQTSLLLTHNTNLTLGAKGTTLIQLDQCSQRSVISISSSFNDLHTVQTQINQVRRGNNLIQFYHWGPVYVHLQTKGARIKWRSKDVYLERGLGYDKFIAGTANAYKDGDYIKVQAKSIQQVSPYSKDKNFQISQVSYKIVLAANQNQLRSGLNCFQQNALKYEYKTMKIGQSTTATFLIDQNLKKRFSTQKFFFAGVLVNLNIEINKTLQNYRFVYPMVDIQREVLFGAEYKEVEEANGQSATKSQNTNILITLIVAILIGFGAWIVYTKLIKKWLRKRRQGLADQGSSGFKYTEFASMDG